MATRPQIDMHPYFTYVTQNVRMRPDMNLSSLFRPIRRMEASISGEGRGMSMTAQATPKGSGKWQPLSNYMSLDTATWQTSLSAKATGGPQRKKFSY